MTAQRMKRANGIVLCLLLAAGLIAAGACKAKQAEQTQEKILSDMLSKATRGQAQVDLGKGEIRVKTAEGDAVITSGGTWPANMPEEVRQFKAGSIIQSTNQTSEGRNNWMVIFQRVEPADADAYIEDLKGDGWTIEMTTDTPRGKMVQCRMEKYLIDLTYTTEQKTMALTVVEQSE
ncbi:MAG: hypothetical protein ACYDH3_11530 [Candidatus Aminicenantales bacterium]